MAIFLYFYAINIYNHEKISFTNYLYYEYNCCNRTKCNDSRNLMAIRKSNSFRNLKRWKTIGLQSGALVFDGKVLKGGTFTVDMTTINTTDLKPGQGKESLDGHLKAEDFFGVEKHKTANLVFKTISGKGNGLYTVTADLTIKGITKPITFDITVKGKTATTILKVDRTKYDIKYNSGNFFQNLGDKTINDEFELTVALKF